VIAAVRDLFVIISLTTDRADQKYRMGGDEHHYL